MDMSSEQSNEVIALLRKLVDSARAGDARVDAEVVDAVRRYEHEGPPGANNVVRLPIPAFIDVNDVMRSMKCKKAMAYSHMRKAIGRKPGERGQLRVPIYCWKRYIEGMFGPAVPGEIADDASVCPIPITRARKPRKTRR